jgi:hypothetical protein
VNDKRMIFSPLTHEQWGTLKYCHKCGKQERLYLLEGDLCFGYVFCAKCFSELAPAISARLDEQIRDAKIGMVVLVVLVLLTIYFRG